MCLVKTRMRPSQVVKDVLQGSDVASGIWNAALGCISGTPSSHLVPPAASRGVCTCSVVIANGNYQPFQRTRRLI